MIQNNRTNARMGKKKNNRLVLNTTNLTVANNGLFKPVFFKFCWKQNKTIIIIFSCLFFLCQIIIPIAAFIADKVYSHNENEARLIYLMISSTMFSMQSVMFIMMLIVLYGRFISSMVNRGDLAYILCSRTSRFQILFTFLMQFFIFLFIDFFITLIPAFFLLGFKHYSIDIYNYVPGQLLPILTTIHPLLIAWFLIILLQQVVVTITILAFAFMFTCIFNKISKFFLASGGVCVLFYLMNILQQFGTMNDSLAWMRNFRFFSILTITGDDIISMPNITRIKEIMDKPIIVGDFMLSVPKLIISDAILLLASDLLVYLGFRIFSRKDLPI